MIVRNKVLLKFHKQLNCHHKATLGLSHTTVKNTTKWSLTANGIKRGWIDGSTMHMNLVGLEFI
jgi:hypothetical protein